MTPRKFHEIWIEQCAAAEDIKLRYGLTAAFDYLVAEKLMNFADAALRHPRFARELPRFVSRVRHLFTPQEIRTHLARIERERRDTAPKSKKTMRSTKRMNRSAKGRRQPRNVLAGSPSSGNY